MSVPNATAAQRFIDALTNAGCRPRATGERKWSALCPAHEDSSPSLSISAAEDRVLVHCFAGCSTDAVLAAIGWSLAGLFDVPREGPTATWTPTPPAPPVVRRPVPARDVMGDLATAIARGEKVLFTDSFTVADEAGLLALITDGWREYLDTQQLYCGARVVIAVDDPVEAGDLAAWLEPVAESVEVLS